MTRGLVCSSLLLALGVVACAERPGEPGSTTVDSSPARMAGNSEQVEVTGCLTSNPQTGGFVLTAKSDALSTMANRAGSNEAESFHYVLVGGDNLQAMVGKEVRVSGRRMGKGSDVDVKSTGTASTGTSTAGETPVVKTTEAIELQVEQLNVASVTATGAACQASQ